MPHGVLKVYLEGALNIKNTAFIGKCSRYCILTVGEQSYKSLVSTGSKPYWNQTFNYKIDSRSTSDLKVQIKAKNTFWEDDLLGETNLAFRKVFFEKFSISITSYPVIRGGKPHGDIRLGLQFFPDKRPRHLVRGQDNKNLVPSPGPLFHLNRGLRVLSSVSSFDGIEESSSDDESRRCRFEEESSTSIFTQSNDNTDQSSQSSYRTSKGSQHSDGPGQSQSVSVDFHRPIIEHPLRFSERRGPALPVIVEASSEDEDSYDVKTFNEQNVEVESYKANHEVVVSYEENAQVEVSYEENVEVEAPYDAGVQVEAFYEENYEAQASYEEHYEAAKGSQHSDGPGQSQSVSVDFHRPIIEHPLRFSARRGAAVPFQPPVRLSARRRAAVPLSVEASSEDEDSYDVKTFNEQNVEVESYKANHEVVVSYEENAQVEVSYEESVEVEAPYDAGVQVEAFYEENYEAKASYEEHYEAAKGSQHSDGPGQSQSVSVDFHRPIIEHPLRFSARRGAAVPFQPPVRLSARRGAAVPLSVEASSEDEDSYDVKTFNEQNVEVESYKANHEVVVSYEENAQVEVSYEESVEVEAPYDAGVQVEAFYEENYEAKASYEEHYEAEDVLGEKSATFMDAMLEEIVKIGNISEVSIYHNDLQSLLHGDATIVLCCYDVKDNLFEFYFKHCEDMASIVGVGLEYAKVILVEGWRVKVKEISKMDWEQVWSKVESCSTTMYKLLKLEPRTLHNVEKEASILDCKKISKQPLLWDLAKYYTLKETIATLAMTKNIDGKYATTSGESSSSTHSSYGGASQSSDGSDKKESSLVQAFLKWFPFRKEGNGKDNSDEERNFSNGKDPIDPNGVVDKDINTTVSVELLPGGEILGETNFDEETKQILKSLDKTVVPNLEFTFICQDGIKEIQITIGYLCFNLGWNGFHEGGESEHLQWLHDNFKVSFGLLQSFGELVRFSFKHLDVKTGTQHVRSSNVIGKTKGKEIALKVGLDAKLHGIGFSGGIDTTKTRSNTYNQQFETHFERSCDETGGGLIFKEIIDPDARQIACQYIFPYSKDIYADLFRSPLCNNQAVKFQGTWIPSDDQYSPSFVDYMLKASRCLQEIVPRKIENRTKYNRQRNITHEELQTTYEQMYVKTMLINHSMTHLDGKAYKLRERRDVSLGTSYLTEQRSMRPPQWKDPLLKF